MTRIYEGKRSIKPQYEDEKVVIARRSEARVTDPDPTFHLLRIRIRSHWPADLPKNVPGWASMVSFRIFTTTKFDFDADPDPTFDFDADTDHIWILLLKMMQL